MKDHYRGDFKALPNIDHLHGVALSGLNGKALEVTSNDLPGQAEIKDALAKTGLSCNTLKSLGYLCQSIAIQTIVICLGMAIPLTTGMLPVWIVYALLSGTTAMGLWVIAHECGHGAFSKNRRLETAIGYILHSLLLVPYFSWQRSHAIHHRFTNHISNGETHVPLVINSDRANEQPGGERDLETARKLGRAPYGVFQLFMHLLIGWPAYLLAGKTGGPKYGTSNHFWPITPFSKKLWPKAWAKKVWLSDCGICLTLIALVILAINYGLAMVAAFYIGPLLVVNAWLVIYTWLHHTDTDVPHFSDSEFTHTRGAFLSIDRPYGKLINFLHHSIGSTHVAHHLAPLIPHYHAGKATISIKKSFPKVYLYNPTPIHKALWHIATNCIAVRKEEGSGRYLWKQPWST